MAYKCEAKDLLSKKNYNILDVENLVQDKSDNFESFINWFPKCRILRVTETEIYVHDAKNNKILLIEKEGFINSLFNIELKDDPINSKADPDSLI